MLNGSVECILAACVFSFFVIVMLSATARCWTESDKDLDNQSKEEATQRAALSTTETQVQLHKIIAEDLEKAKTSGLPRIISEAHNLFHSE